MSNFGPQGVCLLCIHLSIWQRSFLHLELNRGAGNWSNNSPSVPLKVCLPNLKCLAVSAHLSSYHPGVATILTTNTTLTPTIDVGVVGVGKLDLNVLSIGVQSKSWLHVKC